MKARRARRSPARLPRAAPPQAEEHFVLRLYVAGASSRSQRAILRARELCDTELAGRCTLEVIDVYQDPVRARDDQIVATPTLVKELPKPVCRLIGTLTRCSNLFVGLGLDAPGALPA